MLTFLNDSALSFGCRFSSRPLKVSKPVYTVPLPRGSVLAMTGYAADKVSHCICPQDLTHDRIEILIRRTCLSARRMNSHAFMNMKRDPQFTRSHRPETPPRESGGGGSGGGSHRKRSNKQQPSGGAGGVRVSGGSADQRKTEPGKGGSKDPQTTGNARQ
ncbi:unnamed protein product [Cyprideis torosa]|uniref:Uncharacterized protein n=1 Tax=Cyprideis torosa TaxID=163714 RepID=A0A7R8ZJT0_9CRUS|nr:unnamed protein product [Cyprideis torosa]CAG0889166.1 unnamed protein product [Cyprideis torosa]